MAESQEAGVDPGMFEQLRLDRPHAARVYDYFLGGKDNFAIDRQAAEHLLKAFPGCRVTAQSNRMWMHRAARYAAEQGISQYIDLGTGIPTSPNLHEIVQQIVPEAHVVYADNDPIVLTHARALLASGPKGRTAYLDADITVPGAVLDTDEVKDLIDLSKPVALSLVGVLHSLADDLEPYEIVRKLVERLAPGSLLIISHATQDFAPEMWDRAVQGYKSDGGGNAQVRNKADVTRFFAGTELIDPGVVSPIRWFPDEETDRRVASGEFTEIMASLWCGVGRKP